MLPSKTIFTGGILVLGPILRQHDLVELIFVYKSFNSLVHISTKCCKSTIDKNNSNKSSAYIITVNATLFM